VLVGVGTGSGQGGLLNAFSGSGSSSGQKSVISQQEKAAIKATQANPSSPQAWSSLIQARWSNATSNSGDYNASTGQFTAAGKKELANLGQDWQHYRSLTSQPDATVAILAARAYEYSGSYANAASAWEDVSTANPTQATAFECMAANAYAAGQTRKGDLASTKALSLVPKLQRTLLKTKLEQAKTQPSVAQSC
jgi:hypothetical protein